jgi:hypothetical protein
MYCANCNNPVGVDYDTSCMEVEGSPKHCFTYGLTYKVLTEEDLGVNVYGAVYTCIVVCYDGSESKVFQYCSKECMKYCRSLFDYTFSLFPQLTIFRVEYDFEDIKEIYNRFSKDPSTYKTPEGCISHKSELIITPMTLKELFHDLDVDIVPIIRW